MTSGTFTNVTDSRSAEARTLLDAGAAQTEPEYIGDDIEDPIAALYTVPAGYQVVPVDLEKLRAPHRARPARKVGTVHVRTVQSLLDYHFKHADAQAEIWVSGNGNVVSVLDAHHGDQPAWQQHRAQLSLEFSPEWIRWDSVSGKLLGQEQFAEFLEGSAADVLNPEAATILEVAQSLEATTKVDFESAYRTADGQRGFRYKETTTAKAGQRGQLEIPATLTLALRVYVGQEPNLVGARFRYRLSADGLRLGVVIDRQAEILEQALTDVANQISIAVRDTGTVVLHGTPA